MAVYCMEQGKHARRQKYLLAISLEVVLASW